MKDKYVDEFKDSNFIHGKNYRRLKRIIRERCGKHGILYDADDIFSYVHEFPSGSVQSKLI